MSTLCHCKLCVQSHPFGIIILHLLAPPNYLSYHILDSCLSSHGAPPRPQAKPRLPSLHHKRKRTIIAYEQLHYNKALRYITSSMSQLHCIAHYTQITLFMSTLLHDPSCVTAEHDVCYYTRLTCSNELYYYE